MAGTNKRKRVSANQVRRKRTRLSNAPQTGNQTHKLERGDQLCARCRALDFNSIIDVGNITASTSNSSGMTVADLDVLQKSMLDSPCPLCRMFAALCPWKQNSTMQKCILKAFSAVRYHFPNTRGKKDIDDTVVLSVAPVNAVQWKPKSACKSALIYLANSQEGSHGRRILGKAIDPLLADFETSKDWLQYCRLHHKGYCRPQHPTMVHTIHGFKLIDCEAHEMIRSSEKQEYVALSYVWGNNASGSSSRSLPNPAPKAIEDAITVTKKLGFRYLWVDRYCISQDDPSEKHAQISKMDQIYASAEVTIVAAAGEDPDYGLPGVSGRPRHIQPTAVVGKHHLVSSLRPPRDVVMTSKWASRGWTFQEAMLSRRTLFFTDDQIFFECASMSCQEAVRMPLAAVHQGWSGSMGRECDRSRIFPPNGPGRAAIDILKRVCEYTMRNLTFPSDNLNALQGVFNSFSNEQRRYRSSTKQSNSQVTNTSLAAQVHQLWGLPILPLVVFQVIRPQHETLTRRLVLMLGWLSSSPSDRSPNFPSWSWAGWSLPNKIDFHINLERGKVHLFNESPVVDVWIQLSSGRKISCEDIDEQPEYDKIFKVASETLILDGPMLELSFSRTKDKKFSLKPSIEYEEGQDNKKSASILYFWPDIKLDTGDELKRFTERKWKAIIISQGNVFSRFTLLVVKKVGKTYERIGIVHGTYGSARFKKVTYRTIKLR